MHALLILLAGCGGSTESAEKPTVDEPAARTAEAKHKPAKTRSPDPALLEAQKREGWDHYGAPYTEAKARDCRELTSDPERLVGQNIRVTGHITNVCQKAGCWMVIADENGKYVRVTMKDHEFGIPTDTATGPKTLADIEGMLVKKELDAKTLEHLKSEAKGSPEELEEQFAPKYEIVATAVSVRKKG